MKTSSNRSVRQGVNKVRRILVPVDFSPNTGQALRFAVPLARQLGGRIDLLHVVEWQAPPSGLEMAFATEATSVGSAVQARLEKLARKLVPARLLGRMRVHFGPADQRVIAAAQELKSDLILVGTHARTGLKRMLLGSTAEWLVRHAPSPVLTVHPAGTDKPPGKKSRGLSRRINRILVPIDFSARSHFAVKFAANLARTMRARLGLLHVVAPLPLNSTRFRVEIRKYDAETKNLARDQLKALATILPSGIKADVLVYQAPPKYGIVSAAQAWRADLIVLPTRGSDRLKYILLGGTAEAVVRRATCPVLTFGLDFRMWR